MSIVIEGVKMPPKGEGNEVIVRIQPDGTVLDAQGIHLYAKAKELPPHGDLIDREALKEIIGKYPLSWEYGDGVKDCWNALLEATTIIEAEGVKE